MAALFAVALFARLQPGLYRPLEHDEILTARLRTGTPYEINMHELKSARAFDVGRLGKGLVKSFLNGWNPNNHIVNSALMSVSAFFCGFSEWSFRLPVLIASVLLALAGFLWVRWRTDSLWFAFLCGLLLVVHPYFCYFGQTSRGYVINAFLVLVHIALLDFAWSRGSTWSRPALLGMIVSLVLLNVAMFLNVVSMLVTWLVPVYLSVALLLAYRAYSGRVTDVLHDERLQAWVFHAGMACFAIVLFIAGALPHFVYAGGYLGKLRSLSELSAGLELTLTTILPKIWWPLGLFAIAGWALMFRKKSFHWLGATFLVSIVMNTAYSAVTRKLLFPRIMGYVAVFVVLGIAWLWRTWSESSTWPAKLGRAALVVAMLAALVDSSIVMIRWEQTRNLTYSDAAEIIRQSVAAHHEDATSIFIPSPWVWGEEMLAYLPADRRAVIMTDDKSPEVVVYLACTNAAGQDVFMTQYHDRAIEEEVEWIVPGTWVDSRIYSNRGISIYRLRMKLWRSFAEIPPDAQQAIVTWNSTYPYFNLGSAVGDQLNKKMIPRDLRFRTVTHLPTASVQMFASGSQQLALAKAEVSDLQSKGAGTVYILTPVEPRSSL